MKGALAPIDGRLYTTDMPLGVINKTDCFSGHYQWYGLIVQGVCDANLRIVYICVAEPDNMVDAMVYRRLTGFRR